MKLLKGILIFSLVLLCIPIFSAVKTDSLYSELKYANDSVKYTIYEELYSVLRNRHTDSAIFVVERAMEIATKNNNTDKIAQYSVSFGYLYEHKGEIEKAIDYFEQAYNLYLKIDDIENAATSLNNLGAMLNDAGRYNESSKNLFRALHLAEENGFEKLTATINNNIGLLFHFQNEWVKSIEYFQKSIKINRQLNNLNRMALLYNNIGIAYYYLDILDSVLISFERSLDIYIELDNKKGQTRPLFNIGEIYSEMGDFTKALEYYERSLKIEKEIGYLSGYATSLVYIGELYLNLGEYTKALKYQHEGIDLLKDFDLPHDLLDAYNALSETYKSIGVYDSAFHYQTIVISLKDSLFSLEKSKQISELETAYETEKKEQQIILQKAELKYRSKQTISLLAILLLTIGLTVYVIINNRKRKLTNQLLSQKNKLLSLRNKQITHSITYASFIQKAILPNKDQFKDLFTESFLFYKPKDIVSGDFFWVNKKEDEIILAVADCTGHGVPGAIMSIMGITFLQEITDNYGITQPDLILNKLREKIIERLQPKNSNFFARDGIELAICTINTKTKTIDYSGAYTPAILFTKEGSVDLKPNKMPIGFHRTRRSPFTKQTLHYSTGDKLYIYTDGYTDQFGGPAGKKYGPKQFRELLTDIQFLPLDDQFYSLLKGLKNWQGKIEQIDDVTVIGVQL